MANFLNPLNPTNFGMNVTGNFNNLASSGTFRLPSNKVSSSGPELSIQLSNGNGAFTHDPKIYVEQTPTIENVSRLVIDASTTEGFNYPNARINFVRHANQIGVGTQEKDGDLVYMDDPFLAGQQLYFNRNGTWIPLSSSTAPSSAAGPIHAVQFNSSGGSPASLGGLSSFRFIPGTTNQLAIDAELNLSNNNNTLDLDSQGFTVTTDAAIDISNSIGTADLDISTSANLKLTSANGNIVRTSGNVTSTLSIDYLTLTNANTSEFGVRISDEANFNDGAGASLYLGPSGSRSAILEMNVNQNLGGAPLGKLTRIYQQTPASSATSGGYRVLYGAGQVGLTNNYPTIADLGDGTPLKYGEFYIGEGRYSGRPHINYNLASGATPSGFGTFNICNSTLAISDDTETLKFVAMRKTANSDGQILVGDGTLNRVDIRGGDSGINSVVVGMITVNGSTTTSGGGEFRAKRVNCTFIREQQLLHQLIMDC